MFEAAVRILEDEGLEALTTNRVAALVGTDSLTTMLLASAGDASPAHEVNGFVLNRAVGGAIRGALMRDENMLASAEFEEVLVRLIGGFVMLSNLLSDPPGRRGRGLA